MPQTFTPRFIHCKVIEKTLHKCRYIFSKNLRNYSLEDGERRFQTKHHYYSNEHAPIHDEHGLFLVVRVHVYLIVSVEAIQKTIHVMARNGV